MKRVRNRRQREENKGFSLAELIVTVLILGILAVAITPQISTWLEKSKAAKDEAYAGEIAVVAKALAQEHLGKGDLGTAEMKFRVATNTLTYADGSTDSFSDELKSMISASKCIKPEQKGKTYFEITITPHSDGVSVSATAKAMP